MNRQISHSNFYPQIPPDINFQLQSLNHFPSRGQQILNGIPNLFEKSMTKVFNLEPFCSNYLKDQWILHNYNESQKMMVMQNECNNNQTNIKVENQNFDQNLGKFKKIKRNESAKKLNELANSTSINQKSNIKNTYINKINNLISDPKLLITEEDKIL